MARAFGKSFTLSKKGFRALRRYWRRRRMLVIAQVTMANQVTSCYFRRRIYMFFRKRGRRRRVHLHTFRPFFLQFGTPLYSYITFLSQGRYHATIGKRQKKKLKKDILKLKRKKIARLKERRRLVKKAFRSAGKHAKRHHGPRIILKRVQAKTAATTKLHKRAAIKQRRIRIARQQRK